MKNVNCDNINDKYDDLIFETLGIAADNVGIDDVIKQVIDLIKRDDVQEYVQNYSSQIADAIYKGLEAGGITDSRFTLTNIENWIKDKRTPEDLSKDIINISNALQNTEEELEVKYITSEFLRVAYGDANEIRRLAIKKTNTCLWDAFFLNRGSITSKDKAVVNSTSQLNDNIREYQKQLVQDIKNYLSSRNSILSKDELNFVNNFELFIKDTNNKLIVNPELVKFQNLANKFLSPSGTTAVELRKLQSSYKSDTNSKIKLDAYNAFIIFSHFDEYISLTFGKVININPNERGKKSASVNKYTISDNFNQLSKTWRTNENIDVEKEVNGIIRIMIETTPIYDIGENRPTEGKYMTFQYFSNVISKIKSLGTTIDAYNIVFDKNFILQNSDIWNSLSPQTKNYLKGKSLAKVINSIRLNPRGTLHYVLELLSNSNFYNTYKKSLFKTKPGTLNYGFTKEEVKHIYSLHKAISGNVENSIRTITGFDNDMDYYSYFTCVSDSIFQNSFVQYRRDVDGNLKTVLLTDHTRAKYRFNILTVINNQKNSPTIAKYKESVKDLNIDFKDNIVTFQIPNTEIKVQVNPYSEGEGVQFVDKNNVKLPDSVIKSYLTDPNKRSAFIDFIDRFTGFNIRNKSTWLDTYIEQENNDTTSAAKNLLTLTSRIVANSHLANTIFRDQSRSSIERSGLSKYIKYNTQVNRINILSRDNPSNKQILSRIADTLYILDGLSTSTLVKDSQQAAQNLQSFSRLLGYYPTQFEEQCLRENSSVENLFLLNTPGFLLGHTSSSEYYDEATKRNKEITKFTVGEMVYSGFMNNFLPALFKNDKFSLVANHKALFQASVNSDKGTIGQLVIDLGKKITLSNGTTKEVYKLTPEEIKEVIMSDFGRVAIRTVVNIQNTINDVSNLLNTVYPDAPRLNYANNFKEFNIWWNEQIDLGTISKEANPLKVIQKLVHDHNKKYPNNIITLVDNVHINTNKVKTPVSGINTVNLSANNVLLSQLARYSPNKARSLGVNISQYYTYDEFARNKRFEVLETLIRSKTQFNLDLKNDIHNEAKKQLGDSWINNSNTMGLAKVRVLGKEFYIFSAKDMYDVEQHIKASGLANKSLWELQDIQNSKGENIAEIDLNPIIDQYNLLDHWITQSWMYSTVGNLAAHPYGKAEIPEGTNPKRKALIQESASYLAQHKRNVSMTAQMHQFQLNLLKGIPSKYNISVIEDITDFQSILFDNNVKIKPHDGATFVNPFINYLENYSLGGDKAGFDKKQFVHYYMPEIGMAGIIKTAGFTITNDRIRRSPDGWGKLMFKMTNQKWRNQEGTITRYNILKNWKNQDISFDEIYFAKNGEQFAVQNLQFDELTQTYSRDIYLVDNYGRPITGVKLTEKELAARGIQSNGIVVESNYDAWQNLFGGQFSLEINPESKMLQPSESSIRNVVKAMNQVGDIKSQSNGEKYNLKEVETQEQLYQPLKMSDIHYLPTQGAIKQCAGNINSIHKMFSDENDLDFMQIEMLGAGIQLDKEHHADDSDLSLPTQIISACSSLGYTIDIANELYEGLANSARMGIKTLIDAADVAMSEQNIDALLEQTLKLVTKELAEGTREGSFAKLLAQKLMQAIKENPDKKYSQLGLPISSPTIYNQVVSIIASFINKNAIKIKIPGLLAVLTPSYGLYKMYGNRTYDTLYNWSESDTQLVEEYMNNLDDLSEFITLNRDQQLLKAMQWQSDQNSLISINSLGNPDVSKIRLGRTYKIRHSNGWVESRFINSPLVLRNLKDGILKGEIASITEDVSKGRELGAYNVTFSTTEGNTFSLWELDSVCSVQELMNLAKQAKKDRVDLNQALNSWGAAHFKHIVPNDFKATLKYYQNQVQQDLEKLSKHVQSKYDTIKSKFSELSSLNKKIKESTDYEELTDKYSSLKTAKIQEIISYLTRTIPSERISEVLKTLGDFGYSSNVDILQSILNNSHVQIFNAFTPDLQDLDTVLIDNVKHHVNKQSIEEEAYEIIMPKTFLKEFGFSEFTDLNEVKNDEDWFTKRIIQNLGTGTVGENQYDCVFKRSDGKHYYVIDKKHLEGSGLVPTIHEIMYKETEDGKKLRIDANQNVLYEILPGMEIYQTQNGEEVIVVNNVSDIPTLADNLDYDLFDISYKINGAYLEDMASRLENSSKKLGKFFEEYINLDGDEGLTSEIIKNNLREQYKDISLENYKNLKPNNAIIKAGRRKYTAFLKSLEIVAARIPAQSLQSFMPMKVVAYENPNRNSAYVSDLQILLQGSK